MIDRYKDQLHSILLNDERLGNADDIGLILKGNKLIGVQAKGSRRKNVWTFGDLLSLLPGLYKSFNSIQDAFPGFQIEIISATSKSPSTTKFQGEGISFLAFIKTYWEPFKRNDLGEDVFLEPGICNEWFRRIQQRLAVSEGELLTFLNHLELLYGIEFFGNRRPYEQKRLVKYYDWFLKAKITQKGVVSSTSFFDQLGLSHTQLSHEFPVDEPLYVNNQDLRQQVAQSLGSLDKGYIFLKGAPGMGKSTFLQMEINQQSLSGTCIFKYLCYRDDRQYSIKVRGDEEVFLSDLNSQFSVFLNKSPGHNALQEEFHERLIELSQYASENNIKILVVLDGIDHISRKQKPAHPFTKILPLPHQIPDRVVFLVAGQHFDDIDWFSNLSVTGNLISKLSMNAFDICRVRAYLVKKLGGDVPIGNIQKLMIKTKGNPLFLNILCQRSRDSTDFLEDFDKIMGENPDFKEDLNELYEDYWGLYNFQEEKYLEAAGLLARIKGPIDTNWLKHWPESRSIEAIIKKFHFLFIRIENLHLFEYETFNNFLFQKSATIFDRFDQDQSKKFYLKLLDYSDRFDAAGFSNWYKVFYLIQGERVEELVKMERSEFIRQFLELRPIGDILADLSIILEYTYNQKIYESVFDLLLLKAEFEMRSYNFSEFLEFYIPLLKIFDYAGERLPYLLAVMLQSEGFQVAWKLSLCGRFLTHHDVRDLLGPLFKDFYSQYKGAIPANYYTQELSEILTDWVSIPILLGEEIDKIFQTFTIIFPDLLEKRYNTPHALIPVYIYLVFKFGMILCENDYFDELRLIYDHLDAIIQNGGWQIYEKDGNLFYRNTKEEKLLQTHIVGYSIDPFQAKLRLKLWETHRRNIYLIEPFVDENPAYKRLLEVDDDEILLKLRFHPADITDDELTSIFKEGASMRYYSRTTLLNRIWIYRQLQAHPRIRDNSSLLEILNSSAQNGALPNLSLGENSYFFQWEVALRDFALLYGQKLDRTIFAPVMERILNLIDVRQSRDVLTLSTHFQDVIFVFIQQVQEHFGSMGAELMGQLSQRCDRGSNFFESPFTQLRIYEQLKRAFSFPECDKRITQIIKTHTDEIFEMAAPWSDKTCLGDVILALASLDREHVSFIDAYRGRIRELFEKVLFRIGARKDYQLFFLIHLLENLINFFDPSYEEFIDCLAWICQIINFTRINTEHNAIYSLIARYIEILSEWNPRIASAYKVLVDYHPHENVYSSDTKKPIELDQSQLSELAGTIRGPETFLTQIQAVLSGQEGSSLDYDIRGFFEKIFRLEGRIEGWINILHHLTDQDPHPLDTFDENYATISGFLEFLNYLDRQGIPFDSQDRIRIALAELHSPGSTYSFQTSLRKLFDLDQDVAFRWGWANLGLIIRKRDILWSIMSGSDWIVMTFLTRVNKTNYKVYWEIYLNYLKELFDFIPFPDVVHDSNLSE